MKQRAPRIFVLSAESGAGKTTLCLKTISLLQQRGVEVAGLVSPAQSGQNDKTGILVLDIRSGEQRLLAKRGNHNGLGWNLDPDALEWGAEVLRSATPCDVLVVDELGPLELKQDKGWVIAWEVLDARDFRAAVIVVRPSLIQTLKERLRAHDLEFIPVTPSSPTAAALSESILSGVVRKKR